MVVDAKLYWPIYIVILDFISVYRNDQRKKYIDSNDKYYICFIFL